MNSTAVIEPMQSINFELLRNDWPELASLAGFAEAYAHNDPVSSLTKLRSYCEFLAKAVHHQLRLPKLVRPGLLDLLDDSSFKAAVAPVVLTKMHALRVEGNRAVHNNEGDSSTALRLLKDAHDLARWLGVTFLGLDAKSIPTFTEPPVGGTVG